MGFSKLGLSDHITKGISAAGYAVPTPIQALSIGPALAGRDIIGVAQTGTGKTAAFVLPLLQRLAEDVPQHTHDRQPRALVLTPTRELAQQVHHAVARYGRFLTLRSVALYGGASIEHQISLLKKGADIIVATPGRLLDLLDRGAVRLAKVQMLVLDEADRMLDMGFIHDVRRIIAQVPHERQTMLFSATLSNEISALAAGVLRDPHTVEAGERRTPVESITQHFYFARRESKTELLLHALQHERMDSVLVFARTKHGADKICRRLERSGVSAVAIHSNRTQPQRDRALEGFKQGKFRVLVATDIAARGIDVTGISHVINYDIPHYAEDYIHRIGRTGRAGASGDAITFVGSDEQQHLRKIEQFTGKKFPVRQYPGFAPPAHDAAKPSAVSVTRPTRPMPATPKRNVRPGPGPMKGAGRPVSANAVYGRPQRPGAQPNRKHPKRKQQPFLSAKKRGKPKKLDSYSSSTGGSWSNY